MPHERPESPAPAEPIELSIVVPVYNEAGALEEFFGALLPVLAELDLSHEVVCVNDGSTDDTLQGLLALRGRNPAIKIVDLSRNFGKDVALTAGIDFASGRAIIPIDADLQDPPGLIPELVHQWQQGHDVVYAVRAARDADGAAKRATAHIFYSVFNRLSDTRIPEEVGDYRLIDRRVADAIRALPERNRFMKGLFAWVGFRQAGVSYVRPARRRGRSRWSYWRLWNFALDGITAFSTAPLRVWTYLGGGVATLAFLYALFLIARVLIFGRDVPGYASLMVVVLFLGGIQLLTLGILGEYIGRIYQEVKHRPIYLVNRTHGFDNE